MVVEIITKEDLREFKAELLKELKVLLGREEKHNSTWLRTRQVRKILHISPNTVRSLRINGKLKFTKVGRIFYYNEEEVYRMLEGKRHE